MKKSKSFLLPAHVHIELKPKGITYNSDRPLKHRHFQTPAIKALRQEVIKRG